MWFQQTRAIASSVTARLVSVCTLSLVLVASAAADVRVNARADADIDADESGAVTPIFFDARVPCAQGCDSSVDTTFIWPVRGAWRISSHFGRRVHPLRRVVRSHRGVDVAAASGTPILATAPGRVRFAGWKKGYGRTVEIDHGNGWVSRYAHARKLLVQPSDEVDAGQIIAEVGRSGAATGAHLHFEVWKDGKVLNPMALYPDLRTTTARSF